ncbi:unnamed protein product [Dracunculus medinensis]|uniref:Endo/exonuclease/phosphatase domain-containing protein n=1 Tax=Dracunculus medinensis TaxID=318479 RepID=A0A0N4U589_DRAME|nr:unnamed protein product [Dracunculus medinensis]
MAYARFKGKFCNISLISIYTPALLADDRDMFGAELRLLTKSLLKYGMVIIGGDWNARVGHAAAMASTIGKYGIGDRLPGTSNICNESTAQRDRNHYWSDMATGMQAAARLGDNTKLFCLLHKA